MTPHMLTKMENAFIVELKCELKLVVGLVEIVDKVIPENDYIKGNVVFCINKINIAKSDFTLKEIKEYMPTWYEKIQNYLMIHE